MKGEIAVRYTIRHFDLPLLTYVFDDRVVLNFNFTDDAKTVTREEVLGSSAVDNAPPNVRPFT